MDNWLLIVVAIYLICMVLNGFFKGFIRLAVSTVALVISLVAVSVVSPHLSNFIKHDTPIYTSIQKGMGKALGLDEAIEIELPAQQRTAIEGLALPKHLKKALLENNNYEVYNKLGVNAFSGYISSYLADIVVNIISFLFSFVVAYSILRFVMFLLDIVAKLPIIHGINKLAGGLLGGIQGFIFLWIVCLVITAFAGTGMGKAVIGQIESSAILSFIYNNNIFTNLILGFINMVV